MNKLIILSLLLTNTILADEWEIKNFNFYMENDADFRTDREYSYGSEISLLYYRKEIKDIALHIPFTAYKSADNYISFAYSQEIYTPSDIESSELIEDERPYAGYMYFSVGIYQSYEHVLRSLIMQAGLVGPSANMESVQKFVHGLIGSPMPQGWDNQLEDELTLQINYSQKHYYNLEKVFGLDTVAIPEFGFELGNASTKAFAGSLLRLGWGVPKDYGTYSMTNSSYSKIPLSPNNSYSKSWIFCFNFGVRTNIIVQDIFLDGNSFTASHSVEKENFTLEGMYGFSLRYENIDIDYVRIHTTKEYTTQQTNLGYGSFLFSYNY
jgi:hypothetical protein